MLDLIKNNFSPYNRNARVYPTLIALTPVYLLTHTAINSTTNLNIYFNFLSNTLAIIVLLYISSDIIRNLGKIVENKIFKEGSSFPTTVMLLHKSSIFSDEKKKKIHNKILSNYSITLSSEEEERNNENIARKRINEAVGQIRQQVGDGRLLLQFNTRYGFWRNLIGASFVTIPFCCINVIVYKMIIPDTIKLILSLTVLVVFLFLYMLRKQILSFIGRQYAEQLYLEFLNIKT